jgi:serine/threonine-protein kinase
MDTVALDAEETRAFLQHRLALLGRWGLLIGGISTLLFFGLIDERVHHAMSPHGYATLTLLLGLGAVWLLCRASVRLSMLWLRVIDAALVIGLGTGGMVLQAVVEMGPTFPPAWPMPTLQLHIVLALRAALIPSTPRRTAALGTIGAAIVAAGSYLYFVHGLEIADPLYIRVMTGVVLIWCITAVASSTLVSHVIFGLRRRAREAAQLGQYTLVEKIGEGGMGAVYRARHALLRRPTAIKLLLPERTNERDLARFEREVQLTSRLTHPNTIAIYDFGRTSDNVFYYAMEFVDGVSLERLVEDDGPQPPARVIHLLAQACGALAEAHGVGLIHRDIKPANLLLSEHGWAHDVVKVVDFGLIKDITPSGDPAITMADTISGTPHYMSPEAILDPGHLDGRSDIYALGAVGYWLLTGKVVFEGGSAWEVCSRQLLSMPVAPSTHLERPLPEDLERIILRALEKAAGSRFGSAVELRSALLACGDAGAWSAAQADAWWAGYRKRSSPAPGRASTRLRLSVDLGARQAEAPRTITTVPILPEGRPAH